jgi:hypothetical protein
MKIDYEKLDVYHAAIDFVVTSNNIIEALPRGHGYLIDQLQFRKEKSKMVNW